VTIPGGIRHVRRTCPFLRNVARHSVPVDADAPISADGFVSRGRNWGRGATAAFAVCLDVTAAFLMTTRQLSEATAGVGLAGLGWFVTGRLAVWRPRNIRSDGAAEVASAERCT
jgi:hypothetical protein